MRTINPNLRCSRWRALVILLVSFFGTARGVDQLSAHEFADGHVERSLSFVVQDQKVFVEYGVGCNTNTMKVLLKQWQSNSKSTSETVTTVPPAAAGPILPTVPIQPETSDSPAMAGQDIEIEKSFQSAVLGEIASQLEVTCNGKRVDLKPLSVELSPRHHVNALARLEFDLPSSDKIRLIAHDVVFPDNEGAVKYALKPKQSAILLRSNVAPILVRAERVDLNGLGPQARAQKTTVDCELSFVPHSDQNVQ